VSLQFGKGPLKATRSTTSHKAAWLPPRCRQIILLPRRYWDMPLHLGHEKRVAVMRARAAFAPCRQHFENSVDICASREVEQRYVTDQCQVGSIASAAETHACAATRGAQTAKAHKQKSGTRRPRRTRPVQAH
jgi:hypothetical protein